MLRHSVHMLYGRSLKQLIRVIPGVILIIVALGWFELTKSYQPSVRLNSQNLKVHIADSEDERLQGLSGKPSLEADEAMLFVYETPGIHCMWMRDMNFSIDMVWFDESGHEIHHEHDVAPSTYPSSFCPPSNAKYVLEVAAGESKRLLNNEDGVLDLSNR